MPNSNTTTRGENSQAKKSAVSVKGKPPIDLEADESNKFLNIAVPLPILPGTVLPRRLSRRNCHSVSSANIGSSTESGKSETQDAVSLQWIDDEKTIVAIRVPSERDKNPDRICLDRRGLTAFPNVIGEPKLRLMSLQHNLLTKLDGISNSQLANLVFLDLYDNQIAKICSLDSLENLRVLLIGKNRISKIEGLRKLSKLEVLDLHGNQIPQITGLEGLISLKVLNLAGNNIKMIDYNDFKGLAALKELNLRRNKIKTLLGFGNTPQLQKLYLSNNDIQKIEDMGSIAKAIHIREISVDGNPVTLNSDYAPFLISYLPSLQLLSSMQINEQTRRSAAAWRTAKEQSNSAFLDLSVQVCMNVRREEAITNAKTNWEFIRTRTKSLTGDKSNAANEASKLQNASKFCRSNTMALENPKIVQCGSLSSIHENVDAKKIQIKKRANSADNIFKIDNKNDPYPLEFKLPPILGCIIDNLTSNKIGKNFSTSVEASEKQAESSENSDSESSESHESLKSNLRHHLLNNGYASSMESDKVYMKVNNSLNIASFPNKSKLDDKNNTKPPFIKNCLTMDCTKVLNAASNLNRFTKNVKSQNENSQIEGNINPLRTGSSFECCSSSSKSSSVDSSKSIPSDSSSSSISRTNRIPSRSNDKDRVKSAQIKKSAYYKNNRAATARVKYRAVMPPNPAPQTNPQRAREQGGDYLIEIVDRCLNVYGENALRFIDRHWDSAKAEDVNVVRFNYAQFNSIALILCKIKTKFPNVEHYVFKETNISYLGQLNALAEVQGLTSILVEAEGNPIISKSWKSYAIFRLAHWGLRTINDKEITEQEIEVANREYSNLGNIVMLSLPESLLQPLLQRLHLEKVQKQSGELITAKQFLFNCDPALRNVVAKEALQWRKGSLSQEDLILRHKCKIHFSHLIDLTVDAIQKLAILDNEWPQLLFELVLDALKDFSQMDIYMKHCMKTLEEEK